MEQVYCQTAIDWHCRQVLLQNIAAGQTTPVLRPNNAGTPAKQHCLCVLCGSLEKKSLSSLQALQTAVRWGRKGEIFVTIAFFISQGHDADLDFR